MNQGDVFGNSRLVRSYRVAGEVLTWGQEAAPLVNRIVPNAYGVQYDVDYRLSEADNMLDKHRMGIVRRVIHEYWLNGSPYINIGGGISYDPASR